MAEIEIKKQIDDYIKKCKPGYLKREDVNETLNLLERINNYINKLEIKNSKCNCNNYNNINKENELLKTKLESIKYNIEKNTDIQNIIINLEKLKNDESIVIRIFLKIFFSFFYIILYILINYNNRKIKNK